MKLDITNKSGFVLLSTMIVFIIFSSSIILLSQLHQISLKQQTYFEKAERITINEFEIVDSLLLNIQQEEDYSITISESDYFVQVNDSSHRISINHDVVLEVWFNLEKKSINHYNYDAHK